MCSLSKKSNSNANHAGLKNSLFWPLRHESRGEAAVRSLPG